jgi:uncharacterized caspase-like protein
MALRAALCVGIDDYVSPYELSGCARDAKAWAAALADLGFEVTTLTNHRATRTAILDGLAGLVGRAANGDSIVFQFAGHGTQVDDLDGDERDGKDEALCPFDWGEGALIIDDDLRAVLAQLPRGVTCSCFIDCCHSGTITRLVRRAPGTKVVARRPRFLFAACQAEEVAHETDEGGDFTTRALPLLARGAKGWTNQQFVDAVVEAFGPRPLQRPRLDCAPAAARKRLLGL